MTDEKPICPWCGRSWKLRNGRCECGRWYPSTRRQHSPAAIERCAQRYIDQRKIHGHLSLTCEDYANEVGIPSDMLRQAVINLGYTPQELRQGDEYVCDDVRHRRNIQRRTSGRRFGAGGWA